MMRIGHVLVVGLCLLVPSHAQESSAASASPGPVNMSGALPLPLPEPKPNPNYLAATVSGPEVTIAPRGGPYDAYHGPQPYVMKCPDSSFITKIDCTTDDGIKSIGPITCTCGTCPDRAITRVGERHGDKNIYASYRDLQSANGFSGAILRAGAKLGMLQLVSSTGARTEALGYGEQDQQALVEPPVQCPAGYVMTGIHGLADTYDVITVGLFCRKYGPSTGL